MDRKSKKRINLPFWTALLLVLLMAATAGFYLNQRFQANLRTAAALALKVPQAEGVLIGMQEKGYANFPEEKEIEEKALQIEETYGYSLFPPVKATVFSSFL